MNIRIFTLRFNPLLGGFDDAEVRQFLADKEVHSVHDHAFIHHGTPHLALVVTYHGGDVERVVPTGKDRANDQEGNWRKLMKEGDLPLFNSLREWRSGKAKEEGVPPYFVATNRQLAEIARNRPDSLAALGRVDGFGEGRLKKYGRAILALLGKQVGTDVSSMPDQGENSVPEPGQPEEHHEPPPTG